MAIIKNTDWEYIKEGIKSESHTPIYKMHKYFARRPQNVFSELIKNYSKEGDCILDPFCGGGVTMVEGAALNRHVIANDINPLATFITRCELAPVKIDDYLIPMNEILEEVRTFCQPFFLTLNRETGKAIPVRWYEHAYVVACPNCKAEVVLSSDHKKTENGKKINGWYTCPFCGSSFQGSSIPYNGYKMLTVTYKTTTRTTQRTVEPNDFDLKVQHQAETAYEKYIEQEKWFVPHIEIPSTWDRQQEDCLHKKGFTEFSNFFTKRSILAMSFFLRAIQKRKPYVSPDVYNLLLLTFSATLRYTNNMTISTAMWQDGRPVAWAKHAYWMSYQFVEVNPIEYIEKRITAIKAALVYQKEKFKIPPVLVDNYKNLRSAGLGCLLLNQDSCSLPLPDESVDLVLTDPPYGSNVQYGELSAFWLSWLYDELNISADYITDLSGEILVQRKNKVNSKSYSSYYVGLKKVYSECFRVLKKGQPLVFTFNSKDAKVWLAVLKAVLEAGFILEPEGVIYQEPIENYKNTAHTMALGTVHGDFIYTFVKPLKPLKKDDILSADELLKRIHQVINSSIEECLQKLGEASESDLYIFVLRRIIPLLAKLALSQENYDFTSKLLNGKIIESAIKESCLSVGNGMWRICN